MSNEAYLSPLRPQYESWTAYFRSLSLIKQLEHLFYALYMLYGFTFIYSTVYSLSVKHTRRYLKTRWLKPPILFPSYFHGIDFADVQWRGLVEAIVPLATTFAVFVMVSRYLRRISPQYHSFFIVCFGVGLCTVFHGFGVFWMLLLQILNYYLIASLPRFTSFRVFMFIMWTTHISVLLLNDRFADGGKPFAWLSSLLPDILPSWAKGASGAGFISWTTTFNMSTLRMIAFNTDYAEALVGPQQHEAVVEKHSKCVDCLRSGSQCYRFRTELSRSLGEYNLMNYLASLLYAPLYLTGPMMSFNAFVSYGASEQRTVTSVELKRYSLRVVALGLFILVYSHPFHVISLIRTTGLFVKFTLAEKCCVMYLTLGFLWLKFNVIWKTFRLIALFDGFDPPEDMQRCYSNTTTVTEFWRDWHASFNQWIVRYMYVPMGGSKNKLLAVFPIFTFIALWHDIKLQLGFWAGLMAFGFLAENLVFSARARFLPGLAKKSYYRYFQCAGSTITLTTLIVANLYGFGIGLHSGHGFIDVVSNHENLAFFALVMSYFGCGLHFNYIEREVRKEQVNRLKHKFLNAC